jgi:hypothetical protein
MPVDARAGDCVAPFLVVVIRTMVIKSADLARLSTSRFLSVRWSTSASRQSANGIERAKKNAMCELVFNFCSLMNVNKKELTPWMTYSICGANQQRKLIA